jgi:hypothetical protein
MVRIEQFQATKRQKNQFAASDPVYPFMHKTARMPLFSV